MGVNPFRPFWIDPAFGGTPLRRTPAYIFRVDTTVIGDKRSRARPIQEGVQLRGAGRVVFAAVMLLLLGVLNIIYGIGALDDANIFVNDTRFILSNLSTLGWVLIILGVIQLTAGFSLMTGGTYGRVLGIVGGSLGAIGALLSIGGAFPWWSLALFALCIYVVHGIIVYGEDERAAA
jgi:hypothetical protein